MARQTRCWRVRSIVSQKVNVSQAANVNIHTVFLKVASGQLPQTPGASRSNTPGVSAIRYTPEKPVLMRVAGGLFKYKLNGAVVGDRSGYIDHPRPSTTESTATSTARTQSFYGRTWCDHKSSGSPRFHKVSSRRRTDGSTSVRTDRNSVGLRLRIREIGHYRAIGCDRVGGESIAVERTPAGTGDRGNLVVGTGRERECPGRARSG